VARDCEGEVEVGEAVAPAVDCQRSDLGAGDDALVFLREPQHVLAESITLLDGEHRRRF
jgi:hypothetical protein